MTAEDQYPRVLIVAVWFGVLPSWLQLWLNSCRANAGLDWLLITDDVASQFDVPDNVHVATMSMAELGTILADFAQVELTFASAYKVCDYRPLFSCLTTLVPGDWEFWGHCDIDLIFGDIGRFLTAELLRANDRIFGQGHFSVYRNEPETNTYYRKPHPSLAYREILADPAHRGFDEHLGVNRIWHLHSGRFHEDESVVADLDPHTGSLRLAATTARAVNHRPQAFGYEKGRVFRAYVNRHQLRNDEFMYVHFQKRAFGATEPWPTERDAAWLTPHGFEPMVGGELLDRKRLLQLNPAPPVPTPSELLHRAKHRVRVLRRRLAGTRHE